MLKGRPGSGDQASGPSDMAVAVADRPRKKLSFREPEIMGYYMQMKQGVTSRFSRKGKSSKAPKEKGLREAVQEDADVLTEVIDEEELESQAMRVVRTVGQAFEVCHKLSVGGPGEDDAEAAETLASDSHTDLLSDKHRKDAASEPETLGGNDSLSTLDAQSDVTPAPSTTPAQRPLRLDIIPPPPNNHPTRRSPLSGGETYSSPLSEPLKSAPESSLPSAGTPLSAHHELQLLREQLEQQNQQTQAAVAQVHLLRDQLAAETAARLEAQARTHQLLVHNKELLDHISALVAHLQETERLQQQHHQQQQQQQQQQNQHQHQPHVTSVPQLSPTSKVTRWFEMLQPLSRPESGFVDATEVDGPEAMDVTDAEVTEALLSRLPGRKRRKLLGLRIGRVTTF